MDILAKNYRIYYGIYWAKPMGFIGQRLWDIYTNNYEYIMGYIGQKLWDTYTKDNGYKMGYIGQTLRDIFGKNYDKYSANLWNMWGKN